MSAVAGWYTDPGGTAGQLRWWDGERWTEHVTADPTVTTDGGTAADELASRTEEPPASDEVSVATDVPTVTGDVPAVIDDVAAPADERSTTTPTSRPSPPPPAAEDLLAPAAAAAPAWGSGAGSAGGQPPPPPGGPGSTSAWGSAGSAWGGAPHAPSWQPAPRPPGSGVRTGLIVAAVVGVLLVGLVGAVFVGVVGSAGEFNVSVGTDEGFGNLGGEVAFGGELAPGGRVRADVPHGGSLELDLIVDEPGAVTVDVRGMGGFDAVAEITDEFGEVLAHNDDRAGGRGGNHLDPLLDVDLDPGTYHVRVRGFGGDAGSVDVHRP